MRVLTSSPAESSILRVAKLWGRTDKHASVVSESQKEASQDEDARRSLGVAKADGGEWSAST